MYNSDIPTQAELPSTRQLIKSTIIAIVAAIAILLTIVLPAEYGVDPTGIGRVLKLTEMGEIKKQLAAEAEADRKANPPKTPASNPTGDKRSGLMNSLWALIVTPAAAEERIVVAQASNRKEISFTLKPGQGTEYKITMVKGAKVQFTWTAKGGVVNYDMHGTPAKGGKESRYKADRGVPGQTGELVARYDGKHGWFWRNRTRNPVTITLKVDGAFSKLEKMI